MAKAVKRVVKKKHVEEVETPSRTMRLVSVAHGPKVVVEAESDDDAWKQYKSVCGIIQSDHQPLIQELDEDHGLTLDENGVVIGSPTPAPVDEAESEE